MKKILILLMSGMSVIWLNAGAATNYYVATSGNDANSGLSGAPWKTIAKVNSFFGSFVSGDHVFFNRGDIFYGTIIPTKGFTNGNPLVFGAYGTGANPVITGLINIDSWTNLGGNLWEGTSVDSSARIQLNDCNMVLVNGVNTAMGRYPNENAATPWLTVASHTATTLTSTTGLPSNFTKGDVVTKCFNFSIVRYPIKSQSVNTLTFTPNNGGVPNDGWGFFIENDSLATVLDQQNEWWYSPSRKKLRMYSTTMPTDVKISTLDTLVYIAPPPQSVIKSNITFDGIDFVGSNRRTFFIGSASNITIQNCRIDFCGLYAIWGGNNFGTTSANLNVNHCTINHVNSQGIVLQDEYINPYIGYNTIKNTGVFHGMFKVPVFNNGVNSNWDGAFGSIYIVEANGMTCEYNNIDTSGYVGIWYKGSNMTIRFNEVQHFCYRLQDGGGIYSQGYRTAMTVNAGSFVSGTTYAISSVGSTNFTSIGAAVNAVGVVFTATGAGSGSGQATTGAPGAYTNCKIYNNIVHDGIGDYGGTNKVDLLCQGIYCDENTLKTRVYNNTCFNNPAYGIFSNSNADCYFNNNVCYNNAKGQMLFASKGRVAGGVPEREIRDTCTNNILVARTGTDNNTQYTMEAASRYIGVFPKNSIDSFYTKIDSNIYARPIADNITIFVTQNTGGSPISYSHYTLAQYKTYMQSVHPAFESHSTKSPRTITNVSQLSIIYNPKDHDSTVSLGGGSYVDMRNVAKSGSVVLTPYTSMVLINTGSLITPTITWANPAAITYPTALSSTQLNATSGGVAGTFVYKNGSTVVTSGTVLNAGSYTLTVTFTPTDGNTYTTATKSVPLTVNKKTETLAYTVLSKTYTGSPLSPTVTTSPDAGLGVISTTYDGLGTTPTNVKSYAVVTGLTNVNYTATSISGTFTITQATATLTLSNLNQIYDGSPKPVTVTSNPAGLDVVSVTYNGSSIVPSAAGSYSVSATLANGNYTATPATGTLVISTSGASISISNLAQVYSGSDKPVTVTTNPIGLPYTVTYNGGATLPRAAGTYAVVATLTGGGTPATGNLVVSKLTPVITWATPAPIRQSTPLSAAQLNATVNVAAGTKVYKRSNGTTVTIGTFLPLGNNPITMTFTPTNISNINIASKTVTISVTP